MYPSQNCHSFFCSISFPTFQSFDSFQPNSLLFLLWTNSQTLIWRRGDIYTPESFIFIATVCVCVCRWMDQGWWCTSALEDQAAPSVARRRCTGTWQHRHGNIPISDDVCWSHWGIYCINLSRYCLFITPYANYWLAGECHLSNKEHFFRSHIK